MSSALMAWSPRNFEPRNTEQLKEVMFVGQTTVVIGGKVGSHQDTYINPLAIAQFFDSQSKWEYDNRIQIGHIIDFFLQHHTSNTYHFPAIDAMEASIEHRDSQIYKTGWATEVLPDELNKRAASLVSDPIFKDADAIGEPTLWLLYVFSCPLTPNMMSTK